jgi:hypothetical protein
VAALTFFMTSSLVSVHQEMSETDPGTEAYASPVTGWIVSTGTTNRSHLAAQVEQAAATFVDTAPPDGSIDTTTGDCLRSTLAYTGDFADANWVLSLCVRANTNGGTQDGLGYCRLFRGANADGSSATEITAAAQASTAVDNLTTSATLTGTVTFNPGAFSVAGEYLFLQLAWGRTGAGGMTSADVNFRVGNASGAGTRCVTANFTATASVPLDPLGASGFFGA